MREPYQRLVLLIGLTTACSSVDEVPGADGAGSGGSVASVGGGAGSDGSGGSGGSGGSAPTSGGTAGGETAGGGGTTAGMGGGGMAGGNAGGGGVSGGGGSPPVTCEPGPITYELDCGTSGVAIEAHGPPANRINYVIVGDGYLTDELDTDYVAQIDELMLGHGTPGSDDYRPGRFAPELEPYRRYRNFVNICALRVASATSGVEQGVPPNFWEGCPGGQETAFDGCGDDTTRLGYVNNQKVDDAIASLLPPSIEVAWKAVVFNNDRWWHAGGVPMVWSGAHPDATLAAQHEGGHSFFMLGDEYGGSCGGLPQEGNMRINVTLDANQTAGKWTHWLGSTQLLTDGVTHAGLTGPGTGPQETYEGGEYCDSGVFRPSEQSVMNSLWSNYYFNSISLENAVREIHALIDPIDSHTPESTTAPGVLEVKVIDPTVITIEWTIDGDVVTGAVDCGQSLDVAALGLAPGSHVVSARAFDDTPWIPLDSPHGRDDLEQTVTWTIAVP